MDTKVCFKCGGEFPLSEFYKHPAMKDGHVNKCKSCNKKDVIENRKAKVDYYREYDKIRDAKRWDYKTRQCQEWRKSNPEKYRAQTAVGNALRDGKLIRPTTCDACGKECVPHGHHEDYSKPLEVIWLCELCHVTLHCESGSQ
jgi:hypothetical protein